MKQIMSLKYLTSNCTKSVFRRGKLLRNYTTLITRNKLNRLPEYRLPPINNIYRIICARKVSSQDDCESNADNEIDIMEELNEHEILDSDGTAVVNVKQILYPNSKDELIQKLNTCESYTELLQAFRDNENVYNEKHYSQTIILLWGLLRQTEPQRNLHDNKDFNYFLDKILEKVNDLSPDELSCCFLYLSKLGVDVGHKTLKEILLKNLDMVKDDKTYVPLTALSRLCVGVHSNLDLYTILVCKDIVPLVIKEIETCRNAEDLRLITICLQHLHQIITRPVLQLYKDKVNELIDIGIISEKTIKCIFKIVNLICFPHWSTENASLIRKLSLQLTNSINSFQPKDLEAAFKIFQNQLEPASFAPKLSEAAAKLFEVVPSPELLACAVQFAPTDKRPELTKTVKSIISSDKFEKNSSSMLALFKILRLLKISDMQLCNKYWSMELSEILTKPEQKDNYRIRRHCNRYMHFNNNLGGTYRHIPFEKYLVSSLMPELENGISSFVPSKFAKLAAFVIGYGHTPKSKYKFPDIIVEKIDKMAQQFTIIDCLHLSRGLQIALEMRFRNYIPPDLGPQLFRIENVLNQCAEKHLQEDLTTPDVNYIVRSLNNRRASRKTVLYEKAMNKYKIVQKDLNSRIVRDIAYNLSASSYILPEVCEEILNYIVLNRDHIIGDTVEKIISSCYNVGYMPKDNDALHWSAEIIKRDFQFMSGLSIIQACLALCFYKVIPEDLVNKVFNIEFIKRLEDEIQTCYSKATYPERVLNQVMQLNRGICLDFPECMVPWFQQNYIEAQMTKLPVVQTPFHDDIKNLLLSYLKSESLLRCNHVTPYGYRIDFVIHVNNNGIVIPPPKEGNILKNITKIGILLLKLEAFCENHLSSMKGQEQLKMRHLEMLGYKVIHIKVDDWNSMYMNIPGAKLDFLKKLLQIS